MLRGTLRWAWHRLKDQVEGERPVPVPSVLARTYLAGEGIEIGALHQPLAVPRHVRVRYVDRLPLHELRCEYPDLAAVSLVNVDIVDDGERLDTVADASQDFVIASHFLEHCQDPIRTLTNFFRVLRPGGVVYLALPDKRYTFDRDRPVTPLAHLIEDHRNGPEHSREGHYLEYARLVHKCPTEDETQSVASELMRRDFSIHFHVWTQKEMLELLLWLRESIGFDIEVSCKNGLEVRFILRKHDAALPAAA